MRFHQTQLTEEVPYGNVGLWKIHPPKGLNQRQIRALLYKMGFNPRNFRGTSWIRAMISFVEKHGYYPVCTLVNKSHLAGGKVCLVAFDRMAIFSPKRIVQENGKQVLYVKEARQPFNLRKWKDVGFCLRDMTDEEVAHYFQVAELEGR